jgi:hypothetical protein
MKTFLPVAMLQGTNNTHKQNLAWRRPDCGGKIEKAYSLGIPKQ